MFYWSFHPHRTPSHPFRVPNNYIPLLLRYAPIIVEFGPCCYPIEYMPSIWFPRFERKLNDEDNESFYMEIEERIIRLISDDDEEEKLKKKNGAPPLSVNGEKPQLSPRSDSFVDTSCYGSSDMGMMRQWQAPFVCGNCQPSAWLTYKLNMVRKSMLASERKGTGVFIPRYTSI